MSDEHERELRLQRALELAYRYLGHRDRTCAEVLRRLEAKDVAGPEAQHTVAELQRLGYLDDARFARVFAEDRRALDAWGPERIERRLTELGVGAAQVAAAVQTADREDDLQAAVALLERKLAAPPATDRERERALGVLIRKGYPSELAYDAVRAYGRVA